MKRLSLLLASVLLSSSALANNYIGDYNVGDTVDCNFGTVRPSTGASFTLAGSPVISAYVDNSTTELTAGITLTADFDSRTGMNHVRVVASGGNGYAAGTFVSLIITTGTVDSISVVGQEVCSFTLRKGTITGIPAATAGAAGGLQIAGSNAATTYATMTVTGATVLTGNVSMAAGLNITQSTSNTPALVVTGNGTGNGATITSGSGATGNGLNISAASTNGTGLNIAGVGTGNGVTATGGTTGHGISGVGGATSGNGIRAAGTAGNSAALNLVGQGSAAGLLTTGGATGHGIAAVGGATSGSGISSIASTSGAGIVATGVGTTQAGIAATGGSTSSAGISATGGGTGSGILATSGAGATGNGITATAASTNGNGIAATGVGTGAGELATAGATGAGVSYVGGATSGNPISTTVTNPIGPVPMMGIDESGTAQSATATTIVLRSATAFPDTTLVGSTIEIIGGTGIGQRCTPTVWTSSTDTATCPTWATTPDSTSDYVVWGTAAGSGGAAPTVSQIATAVWQDSTAGDFTTASSIGKSLYTTGATPGATGGLFIAGTNAATTITTGLTTTFTGNLSGSVGSVASGGITTGSFASGAINAAAVATDAIGAAELASDAVTEIQSGLATSSALSTVSGFVDTEVAAILDDTGTSGVVVASGSKTGYALSSTGLNAITFTEPTGKPSWTTSTLVEWLAWIGAPQRNKVTQTSTTKTIRNDADNANIAQCTVSDDGTTFTLGECTP